ncbi:hypothetical protein B0H34DRAFT_649014 [Crassisporium funariophilum]|nr:hypothetical protein B0H34DRAFT_649014 [Crassisporium funariophilum]
MDISEHRIPPRSRTWSFYLVFILAVVPLWSSVPLAWVFTVYSLYSGAFWTYAAAGRACFFVASCEVFFSIYHFHLARVVSRQSPPEAGHPDDIQVAYIRLLKAGLANLPNDGDDIETLVTLRPGSPAETITQLERDDPRAIDFRHCLRTWFCKAPWSSIKRLEIQKWLYWAMYNTEMPAMDAIPPTQRAALEASLELLQKRVGCKVEDGANPAIVPMRITIDKTSITWRPLTYYLLVGSVNWTLRKRYTKWWNIQHGCSNGIEYLLRMPLTEWDPLTSPRPIVFIHGLGLGLLQYHGLISDLVKAFPGRPILIPLQPQISQDFFHRDFLNPLNRHQMAKGMAELLEKLGWVTLGAENEKARNMECEDEKDAMSVSFEESQRGVTLLSHSNGSYTHAWMLKGYPEIIARSCFVDPVTFCSWEGDVCYNFFYRPAKTGIELLMRYFVASEIGVSNLLQRHFCWTSNSLWFEEIPNPTDPTKTFFLMGGKDDIVHTERVKRYLTSHGVRENLWFNQTGKHGEALTTGGEGLNKVLQWLSEHEL